MTDWELQVLDIEKTSYTVQEFLEWEQAERLELSPSFQRGQVWRTAAMAYLIDTILRGFPIPPVHIRFVRKSQNVMVREVIDGQQRLSSVLRFIANEFPLAKPRNPSGDLPPWAGMRFSALDDEFKRRILDYSFRAEVYKGQIPDETVYEIFSRINIHSIPLSDQELRNGRYFGEFKQSVYRLAEEHRPLWIHLGLFTSQSFARMVDAQFVSEVLAVQIEGMQNKKGSLDEIYAEFENEWPDRERCEHEFRTVIDALRGSFSDIIPNTRFKRTALFYTLYCVVYHRLYGIPQQQIPSGESSLPSSPLRPLDESAIERLRLAVQNLSDYIEDGAWTSDRFDPADPDSEMEPEEDPENGQASGLLSSFAKGSAGQTDNLRPRFLRFRALWEVARLSQ